MYSTAIAVELRGRGHDVISVRETLPTLSGAPDDEVMHGAIAGGRTLVTEDVRDYRPLEAALLAEGVRHAGVVYTTNRQFPRGDPHTAGRLVRALEAVLQVPPDLANRSIFLAIKD